MSYVLVKQGSYRNQPVENTVFPLVQDLKVGKTGMFVTVDGSKDFGSDKIRVKVDSTEQLEYMGDSKTAEPESATITEADEKRMAEIEERFGILNDMSVALKNGDVRAMIVTGPPGVGKSYGVETTLEEQSGFDQLIGREKYEVCKGAMTPIGLYAKLYEYSASGNVLVFDDCDSVLMDDLSLNILKAALDSGKRRRIYWNADSSKLRTEGIPNWFDFKGSVCFVTNIKFDNVKSKKLKDHLDALMSRCHYIDLTLDTARDCFLRIKQIARTGNLFDASYKFEDKDEEEILDFMFENRKKLREMSLRMALKVADLKKLSPNNWKSLASNTCMKRG
jgi:predicted AAA+ superfamily ATPase